MTREIGDAGLARLRYDLQFAPVQTVDPAQTKKRKPLTNEQYKEIFDRVVKLEEPLRTARLGSDTYCQLYVAITNLLSKLWPDIQPVWIEGALRRRGFPKSLSIVESNFERKQ